MSLKKSIVIVTFITVLLLISCSKERPEFAWKNYAIIDSAINHDQIIEKAAKVVPSKKQYEWQLTEYNAFVHFGMNTFTDVEWGEGTEDPALFNPVDFNAEQWVKVFKDAGMKMLILTAKHHDGFCLWPSKYTEHSVKNSPWKNGEGDIVGEVAAACKKFGLKFGVYISPWDRNNTNYGDSKSYNEYFINQLTELLTNYDEISEVWFDGANGEGPDGKKQVYDWQAFYRTVRKLQPNAVIFGMAPDVRWVGNERGEGRDTEWSVLPVDLSGLKDYDLSKIENPVDLVYKPHDLTDYDLGSREALKDDKGLYWYPAETNTSIRPGWFYHKSQDDQVKSVDKLIETYFNSVGKNGVFLLNVPPDKRGLIHDNDIKSLTGLKKFIDSTFSNNLAADSKVIINNDEYSYTDAFDVNNFMNSKESGRIVIEIELTGEETIDVISIQEEIRIGQRIEEFNVDYLNDNSWETLAEGTTVGYKRLIKFDPVKTDKIRITITKSRLNPVVKSIGLFKFNK